MTLAAGSEFEKLLEAVPIRAMRRRLVRCVAALDFLDGSPPRYLYTSGRPGRCNPRDVDCLYFSPKYPGFFLPVKVLRRVFRGKFVEA